MTELTLFFGNTLQKHHRPFAKSSLNMTEQNLYINCNALNCKTGTTNSHKTRKCQMLQCMPSLKWSERKVMHLIIQESILVLHVNNSLHLQEGTIPKIHPSRTLHCVDWQIVTDILKDRSTFIFRVKQSSKRLHGLLDPED